jgi:putative transposase
VYAVSLRRACKLVGTTPSVIKYKPKPKDDEPIRQQLRQMADLHSRWGFWMMFYRLRAMSYLDNHKRVYRIYTEMKLNLRRKYKKRLPMRIQHPLIQPLHHNLTWSMDFVHDGLFQGKSFRSFNVIDDFNREVLTISIDTSLTSLRVIRELNKLLEWRGKPERLRVDNGPEFIAQAMEDWCNDRGIELSFIQKGKPHQNGFIERFNRTFRDEVLDVFAFDNLNQARLFTRAWMWVYNNERPHSSLGYLTPTQFLLKYGRLHNKKFLKEEFPTFQQDSNYDWKTILSNVTN